MKRVPNLREIYFTMLMYKTLLKLSLLIPYMVMGQIENQVRDDNPGLFKNQRIFHSPPKPLFKGRSHNLNFITDVPDDSVLSATLFFKTDFMAYYQEFVLNGVKGLYQFTYDPKTYPGTYLQYYFVIETEKKVYGSPLNDRGELSPVKKLLVDPVQYFKQQARLNQ